MDSIAGKVAQVLREAVHGSADHVKWPPELAQCTELHEIVASIAAIQDFAVALSKGDLSQELKIPGWTAGALRSLQANLRHLTWQTQIVAAGDYSHKVEYLGEFSQAFNFMVTSLAETECKLRKSKEYLHKIIESVPLAVVLVRLSDASVLYANQSCLDIFHLNPGTPVSGRYSHEFWNDMNNRKAYHEQMSVAGYVRSMEVQMKRETDEIFWALISSSIIELEGELVIISSIQDVQQRKELEVKLRQSEEWFRQIVENTSIPIVITKVDDNTVLYINPAAYKTFAPFNEDVVGKPVVDFYAHSEDRTMLMSSLAKGEAVRNKEVLLTDAQGRTAWVLISADIIEYQQTKVVLSTLYDITDRKKLEQELKYLATTDHLTGIACRRLLLEKAECEFNRSRRYNSQFTILALDIDYFKQVNDNFGHQAGDQSLIHFVQVCKNSIREVDLLGRMGGEEFNILLPETDFSGGLRIAERIRVSLEQTPKNIDDNLISLTVSIGVSSIADSDESVYAVINRADKALYKAKQQGRNQVVG